MRPLPLVLTAALLLSPSLLRSQAPAAPLGHRTLAAQRITGAAPVLDGRLDEPDWALAQPSGDFVEQSPVPGILPSRRSEARVLFDDQAIYIGVRAFDEHPDSIVAPFPRRDDETRSDWIFVEIDSRHDHRTGFGFGVNPRGVQVDATFDAVINYDNAWNGVWDAVARIDSLGWVAEYRIPFSQLAYAGAPGQPLTWGLNVYRSTARNGESSTWSPRLPTYSDLVSHFNDLTGIVPPRRPERLDLVPFTALKGSYTPRTPGDPLSDPSRTTPIAGADLRFRVTPGFTLSAAIHPDFGQVEADPSQVNLTSFETFFPEQRPFFVEGATQYAFDMSLPYSSRDNDFSADQPFYSRRIGRPPHGSAPPSARFDDPPTSTTLLGAAKLSGQSSNGWSVGVMTALTDAAETPYIDSTGGRRSEQVEPTTGYGVARVVRQSLDGRNAFGGMFTLADRFRPTGALDSLLPGRALVAGINGRHRFAEDNYEVSGFAVASRVAGSAPALRRLLDGPGHYFQRPDASHLTDDSTRTVATGVAAQARVAKIGGHFHWAAMGHLISPGFEVNDLGFQRNADWLLLSGTMAYERYRPGRFIRHWILGSNRFGAGWSFGGERRALNANANLAVGLRNYWSVSLGATREWSALATDLLRGGPGILLPPRTTFNQSVTTDSRRPYQLVLTSSQWTEPGTGSHSLDLSPTLSWRATDRLALTLGPEYTRTTNGWQYIASFAPHYLLGRLRETTASLTARVDYAFSSRMTLQLYAQPFVSSGAYARFLDVSQAAQPRSHGRPTPYAPGQISYDPTTNSYRIDVDRNGTTDAVVPRPDFNRTAFNANLVFRWEYRPGSALYLVWTQQRGDESPSGAFSLGRDLGRLFGASATNVVMVKASYRVGV